MARSLLASDAEREACAERLRLAAGEGRLDFLELERRIGAAYRARTRRELEELTVDFPQPPAALRRRRPAKHHIRQVLTFGAVAGGNATLVGFG